MDSHQTISRASKVNKLPKKLVKVDKLQNTTFKGAEGTKIYSVRRKAISDIYNSLSEKRRPYAGVAT